MSATLIAPFRCDITPERPVPLAGYRRRSGVWDRIETRLEASGVIFGSGRIERTAREA